jgi:hypothetical protein
LDVAAQTLQGLSALTELFAGKSKKAQERAFKVQKAISIAGAIIDTYKGAASALATYPPPFGAIAAGATIAMGLANVAKIKAQKFDGGDGGGPGPSPSTPSVGGGGGSMGATPTFNPIDFSILGQRPNQTSQSFVLAGQVSNAQDANAKIKDLSRL